MVVNAKIEIGLKSLRVDIDILVGFIGFMATVASGLGIFMLIPEMFASYSMPILAQAVCGLAMFVSFGVFCVLAQRIGQSRSIGLLGGSTIGAIAMIFMIMFPTPGNPQVLVLMVTAIVGLACISSVWFMLISKLQGRALMVFIASDIGLGSILCLGARLMDSTASFIGVVVFYCVALMSCLAVNKLDAQSLFCAISNKESDKRSKIHISSAIMLSSNYFCFGFIVANALALDALVPCLLSAVVVALVLSIDSLFDRIITERQITPLARPLEVLAFMMYFTFDDASKVIALILLSAMMTAYMILGWAAMSEHVRLSRLSPLRTYSKARLFDYAGFLLGILAGYGVLTFPLAEATIMIIIIAFVICLLSLLSYKPRFPEPGFSTEGDVVQEDTRGTWDQRCRAVAAKYELSERQQEVFMLVALGRSAKYIEKELTISLSTVQTHIRNIYRKTRVHSRQELLDLIENAKLYGEN